MTGGKLIKLMLRKWTFLPPRSHLICQFVKRHLVTLRTENSMFWRSGWDNIFVKTTAVRSVIDRLCAYFTWWVLLWVGCLWGWLVPCGSGPSSRCLTVCWWGPHWPPVELLLTWLSISPRRRLLLTGAAWLQSEKYMQQNWSYMWRNTT